MRDKIKDFIKFEILWNLPQLHWRRYHFRIIGFAMGGAGAGMMLDELIMVIAGAMLITEKPHGKE